MFFTTGVRGRLLLAFLGISAFAVIAAAAAMYAFSKAGDVLEQITQQRLPPALASLELSRQAERIVGAAPALLTAASQDERERTYDRIAQEVARSIELLDQLEGHTDEARELIEVRISPLVYGFEGNLDDLNFFVEQRLATAERQADLLARSTDTIHAAQRLLGPGGALLDATLAAWTAASPEPAAVPTGDGAPSLIERLKPLLAQRKAEVLIAEVNDGFLRTALAANEAELAAQIPRSSAPWRR